MKANSTKPVDSSRSEVFESDARKAYQAHHFQANDENELHRWLEHHLEALPFPVALVASKLEILENFAPDLIVLLQDGRLCLIELKAKWATASALAQLLSYNWLLGDTPYSAMDALLARKSPAIRLADIYRARFGRELPAAIPPGLKWVLVANGFAGSCQKSASYLVRHNHADLSLIQYRKSPSSGCFSVSPFPMSDSSCANTDVAEPDVMPIVTMLNPQQYLSRDWSGRLGYIVLPKKASDQQAWLRLKADGKAFFVYVQDIGYVGIARVAGPARMLDSLPSGVPDRNRLLLPIEWVKKNTSNTPLINQNLPQTVAGVCELQNPHFLAELHAYFNPPADPA